MVVSFGVPSKNHKKVPYQKDGCICLARTGLHQLPVFWPQARLFEQTAFFHLQNPWEKSSFSQEPRLTSMKGNRFGWLKIKQEGLRRCWSMFPLTRVPCWYRFFEPLPFHYCTYVLIVSRPKKQMDARGRHQVFVGPGGFCCARSKHSIAGSSARPCTNLFWGRFDSPTKIDYRKTGYPYSSLSTAKPSGASAPLRSAERRRRPLHSRLIVLQVSDDVLNAYTHPKPNLSPSPARPKPNLTHARSHHKPTNTTLS